MTPEQALEILDQMVARTPATRADHMVAQQALMVLRDLTTSSNNAKS